MRYNQIRECDISNGEGVGVALFVQGCPFNPHCKNCFNPETWDFNGGKKWTPEVKEKFLELIDRPYIKRVSLLGGECLADENLDDVLDLVTEINKRYNTPQDIVYGNCNNHNILNKNTDRIRLSSPNKSIWIYTGYTWNEIFKNDSSIQAYYMYDYMGNDFINNEKRKQIISQCSIMVDGRYVDSQRDITLKWRGSLNQNIWKNCNGIWKNITNEI